MDAQVIVVPCYMGKTYRIKLLLPTCINKSEIHLLLVFYNANSKFTISAIAPVDSLAGILGSRKTCGMNSLKESERKYSCKLFITLSLV